MENIQPLGALASRLLSRTLTNIIYLYDDFREIGDISHYEDSQIEFGGRHILKLFHSAASPTLILSFHKESQAH